MRTYSSLIFVSSRCREEWLSTGAFTDKQTFYIPNCCNESAVKKLRAEERMAVRRRLGLPADRLVAVCVATLQHRKGQDILVDQSPRLLEVAPDLSIYFVGAPIPGRTGC